MHMTGSQSLLARHPIAFRLLLVAVIAAVVVGVQAALPRGGAAATTYTVNSTANTDDGSCDPLSTVPPEDCTLHEAIDAANASVGLDTIKFLPGAFAYASPGTIDVSGGALPYITDDLTIDARGAGVIIDGGALAADGLHVVADNNVFVFNVIGDGTPAGKLIIRDFAGDGIELDADGYTLDVSIGDVIIGQTGQAITGAGIYIWDAANFNDVDVTDNEIMAGASGVFMETAAGTALNNNSVTVTGNTITAGPGEGVGVDFQGDLNSGRTITATVSDNVSIASGEDAVDLEYCADVGGCDALLGTINFLVQGNGDLTGDDEGIDIEVDANNGGLSSELDVNVSLSGNGPITGANDKAVDVWVDVCCGTSESTSTIHIDNNGDLSGDPRGVEVDADVCCGDSNTSTVTVNGNGLITGASGDGVNIDSNADDNDTDGDNNESTVEVKDNTGVTGTGGDGIEVDSTAGDRDSNEASVTISGNSKVIGTGGDGVDVGCTTDSTGSSDEDGNTCTVDVSTNGMIEGSIGGIEIDITSSGASGNESATTVEDNGDISGAGDDGVNVDSEACSDGTGTSSVSVARNGDITSGSGDGVYVDSQAGCDSGAGGGNASTVDVSENGDISGTGDGVLVGSHADADAAGGSNTSAVTVNGNDSISGSGDDGVDVNSDAGDATEDTDDNDSGVTVNDNGPITGTGSDGVEITSEAQADTTGDNNNASVQVNRNGEITGGAGDGVFVETETCCDDANTSTVSVSDNTSHITGGAGDGVDIDNWVGAFPASLAPSQITINVMDNAGVITGVSGDGVQIESCVDFGVDFDAACLDDTLTLATIGGNEIADSGDHGVELCCGAFGDISGTTIGDRSVISDNLIKNNAASGVYLNSTSGVQIGPDNVITGNGPGTGITIVESDVDPVGTDIRPADANTITQNSIYDNDGLGIDLADDGVGCGTESPNGCLKRPTLLPLAGGTKLQGNGVSGATIELFVADESPADQDTGDDPQSGEGKTFIIEGTANASGYFSIQLCGLAVGDKITATQTNDAGNTSEFSENLPGPPGGTAACATPTPTAPTNTPAPTSTPGPSSTPTATATETATATPTVTETVEAPTATETLVPPTATNTTVPPTATNTPVPPTATNTPATPTGGFTPGDVNKDGVVNSVDAAIILQYVAGLISNLNHPDNADANQDGVVNAVDAALILQYEAGLIDCLPPDACGAAGAASLAAGLKAVLGIW